MGNPKLTTKVTHSRTMSAWNVVGTTLGCKYKVARVPYFVCENEAINMTNRMEAFDHANFISLCFNNSDKIIELTKI